MVCGAVRNRRLIAALVAVTLWFAAASFSAAGEVLELDASLIEAVGETVTVKLASGEEYAGAKLLRVVSDRETEQPRRVRLRLATGRTRMVAIDKIAEISLSEASDSGASETEDGESSDAADKPSSRRRKPRLTRRERLAAAQAERDRRARAERRQRITSLVSRNVQPWQPLTSREHAEGLQAHKQRYEQVRALLPSLRVVETEHFLFCTNIAPEKVGNYVAALDRMYIWMQQAYGIAPTTQVWRGKASIFAFARQEEFVAFERKFFQNDPHESTAGICHYDTDRNVCMACYEGDDLDYFGLVLVHETSHGFIHCYKSPAQVPSWVNEGMAEVIASKMVPQSDGVQRKEKQFVEQVKQSPAPRLGDAFFVVDGGIPFDRYGGASSLTRFLIETDQENYVFFIDLMKEGVPWEEALRHSYNATKPEMVAAYGQWIGAPNLAP